MTEQGKAYVLANNVLDRPGIDPDEDITVLARQLMRHKELNDKQREEIRLLREQLNTLELACGSAVQDAAAKEQEITRLREALTKTRRELWHCNEQLKHKGATEGYSVTEALREADAILTQEPT